MGNCQHGAVSRDQSQQNGNGTRSVRGTRDMALQARACSRGRTRPPKAPPDHRQKGTLSWPQCRWLRGSDPPSKEDGRPPGGGQDRARLRRAPQFEVTPSCPLGSGSQFSRQPQGWAPRALAAGPLPPWQHPSSRGPHGVPGGTGKRTG